ncbi:P-loop containing nucleoside triphosphate hydrolase protein [Staphylotrichum tortipilum]|uniref:P-loop containing nucleoside triphosphate hydrolase protein n=1 Tax=Staphylotrichum tortipilum TaxID=2831512 RepID=A0AAN6MEN1_9PEZI|nr:P-loop containing nucleoside triphosphate hydrolase protein [Staphylotrichum longicolle]
MSQPDRSAAPDAAGPDLGGKGGVEGLLRRLEELSEENSRLKHQLQNRTASNNVPKLRATVAYRWRTLYRIESDVFLEEPSWSVGDSNRHTLKGRLPVASTIEYLKRHEDIAFVAFRNYKPAQTLPAGALGADDGTFPTPTPSREAVRLVAPAMIDAMDQFLNHIPDFKTMFPDFDLRAEVPEPYLFWFFSRRGADSALQSLSGERRKLMELFRDWIEGSYGDEWSYIDSQFADGLVSPLSMKYLIRPGEVVVSRKNRLVGSYMAASWVKSEEGHEPKRSPQTATYRWSVDSWAWSFDGRFRKAGRVLDLEIQAPTPRSSVPITSLDIFPLRFWDGGLEELLKKRGRTFWKCRRGQLVSYVDEYGDEMNVGGERYMVDVTTYYQFRRRKEQSKLSQNYTLSEEIEWPKASAADEMDVARFNDDEFPDINELLVFPRTIIAYDLRRKTWTDLEVDQIRDVSWNTQAFDSLAIEDDHKELIQALVTHQIESSKGTDIIADKGNGLIILLHGGPGTGKTFTAESMADFAGKPLYRVTCGDIGTNPEQVETYLESVLHLGLIWDCVVLLDEADVFLEERGQADLARNALVSVFLRVLEYYQGILILTSNRVGRFDEAFKSRIQLSLHYTQLDISQRRKIWRNFIKRLQILDKDNIDIDDLNDHIEDLVKWEMNGREIRNVITTARQLSRYRKTTLRYALLQHVINITGKFEEYLRKVKEGMTDEELARDEGRR